MANISQVFSRDWSGPYHHRQCAITRTDGRAPGVCPESHLGGWQDPRAETSQGHNADGQEATGGGNPVAL